MSHVLFTNYYSSLCFSPIFFLYPFKNFFRKHSFHLFVFFSIWFQGNPTVVPVPNFDPVADANALRKAMKGFGTDEDAIINCICRRSNEQRQVSVSVIVRAFKFQYSLTKRFFFFFFFWKIIQRTFKTHFGKDLIEDIRSETSGNFQNLLVSLLTPIVDFYVKELHDAMAGIGTNEEVWFGFSYFSFSHYYVSYHYFILLSGAYWDSLYDVQLWNSYH